MTKIEWVRDAKTGEQGRTWNPTVGCTRVSEGCRHCFAERMAKRLQAMGRPEYQGTVNGNGRWTGVVNLAPERLEEPLRRKKPTTWFVNSMSDLFHESIPDEFICRVFAVMLGTPRHTYQILTKRPERMLEWFQVTRRKNDIVEWWISIRDHARLSYAEGFAVKQYPWPLPNVWLGVSAENQKAADERVPLLLRTPAAVRFVSAEPLLGPVALDPRWLPDPHGPAYNIQAAWGEDTHTLDWVIAGGESGSHARPCHPDWMRQLRDQCQEADVAFFMKQWGAWKPGQEGTEDFGPVEVGERNVWHDGRICRMYRVGKKAAGRLLDGVEYSEMPGRTS